MNYISCRPNTGNDRLEIQRAIDLAKQTDVCTVVVGAGEWILDSTIYVHDNVHLILDGATLTLDSKDTDIILRNSNSVMQYKNVVQAEQKFITISGKNDAIIKNGCLFLSNVANSQINNITFESCNDFGIITASVLGIRFKNLKFVNCQNAIALGVGTRDCMYHNLSGQVKKNFFVICDYMYEEFRRHHREYAILNNLINGVDVVAENFAYVCGQDIERLIFTNINARVSKCAFNIKKGKHISITNFNVIGKLFNDDLNSETVCAI